MVAVVMPCGVVVVVAVIALRVVVVAAVTPRVVLRSQLSRHMVLRLWTRGGCCRAAWCRSCGHRRYVLVATSP